VLMAVGWFRHSWPLEWSRYSKANLQFFFFLFFKAFWWWLEIAELSPRVIEWLATHFSFFSFFLLLFCFVFFFFHATWY